MSKMLSTPWPFWTGILSQVSKNDDEKTLLLRVIWLQLFQCFLNLWKSLILILARPDPNPDFFVQGGFSTIAASFLQLIKYFYFSQFVGEHELAVLGTPNIGPNGTIVTNSIYGMGDDDLLQLPRINRNQITVGKFIGKYSFIFIPKMNNSLANLNV